MHFLNSSYLCTLSPVFWSFLFDKIGSRKLIAKVDKKVKSIIIGEDSEIEEIVGDAEVEGEHRPSEDEEKDELSDFDLGDDE